MREVNYLQTLRLDDNPLNPTLQIIYDACKKHDTKHEDYESLFAYLRSLEGNVEPLYETKLMFQRKLKVFLCHASQDKPIVHQLYEKLVVEGWIEPWLDAKKLLPGQDWQTEIKNAVETADNVIIFLSNTSINKDGFIQKELRLAKDIAMEKTEDSIFLIPLRLEDCEVPKSFRHYHWVNYFGNEQEQTYKKLLESLKLRLNNIEKKEIFS